MKEENKEFIVELDKETQILWKLLRKTISKTSIKISGIQYLVELDDEILKKFGLNKDIKFIIDVRPTSGGETKYYYKNMELNPNAYYVRPDDYHEVSTLRILQESIAQDTHEPDIMHLERGEETNGSKEKT